jgi:DNA-binding PadR family transcriptional regulator
MLVLESKVDPRRALLAVELLYLVRSGSATGYQIRKAYMESFGISVSFGTIYPLLHLLHKSGYLTRRQLLGQGQKLYALTRAGQTKLDSNASFLKLFSNALKKSNHKQLRKNLLVFS